MKHTSGDCPGLLLKTETITQNNRKRKNEKQVIHHIFLFPELVYA